MFGPWIRGERPRRRNQNCRIIGSLQSPTTIDPKRKSWKDLMREKHEREQGQQPGMSMKKDRESEATNRDEENTVGGMAEVWNGKVNKPKNSKEDHLREDKTRAVQGMGTEGKPVEEVRHQTMGGELVAVGGEKRGALILLNAENQIAEWNPK